MLRVQLNLGRVARIERRGGALAVARNALAVQPGDLLNLRAIEQSLENLARLPSQAAQFQIEPSDEQDASVLVMASAPARRWRVGAGLDNAAARDYGRLQATAQAVLDAPLGLSDQIALFLNRSVRNEGAARHQGSALLSYSIPFGHHLMSLSASRSSHARPIQGLATRFSENGHDRSLQIRWQWTAWRSAAARWNVWGGATQRRSRNAVDEVELVLQRRDSRSADWGISGWLRVGTGELSLETDAAVSMRLAPYADVQFDPPALPHARRAQISWQQPLNLG